MSREIKLRAWDKCGKKYLNNAQNIWMNNTCFGDLLASPNFEIEQYTGLKDANGDEIYEGDIVNSSYKYAQPKISQVVVECGNSYILGEDLATGNEMLVSDHINEIEVIGNVHTKHELLEADE